MTEAPRVRGSWRAVCAIPAGILLTIVLASTLPGCGPQSMPDDQGGDDGGSGNNGGDDGAPDIDGDGVANAADLCPATDDPDQADSDGDGIGDACGPDAPDSVASLTSDGVVQARLDDRLRPWKIVGPQAAAELEWSDDATQVTFTVVGEQDGVTLDVSVDFSDAALLEAIDEAEADSGEDLSALTTYVIDHPGEIQSLVSGQLESSSRTARRAEPAPKPDIIRYQPLPDPEVERHLARLSRASNICWRTALSLKRTYELRFPGGTSNAAARVLEQLNHHFVDLARSLHRQYTEQLIECGECTELCEVRCTPPGAFDTGACCLYSGEESVCDVLSQEECEARVRDGEADSARFTPNQSCLEVECQVGVCCIDVDGPGQFDQQPRCTPATRAICMATAVDQGEIRTVVEFHLNEECSEVTCPE